jgi:hypothetical protein
MVESTKNSSYAPVRAPDPYQDKKSSLSQNTQSSTGFHNLADNKLVSIAQITQIDTSNNKKSCVLIYGDQTIRATMIENGELKIMQLDDGRSMYIHKPVQFGGNNFAFIMVKNAKKWDLLGNNSYTFKEYTFSNGTPGLVLYDEKEGSFLLYNKKTDECIAENKLDKKQLNDFYFFDTYDPKHRIAFKKYLDAKKKYE